MAVNRRNEDHYDNPSNDDDYYEDRQLERRRTGLDKNLIGYWLLGLCNNFAYVIMLSAATDILEHHESTSNSTNTCRDDVHTRNCHTISTGSVLLADILPSLLIKTSAPLYIHHIPFGIRHAITVILQAGSYLLVGTSASIGQALFGVVLASFGSGLGEISYLALASHFPAKTISAWSSGTGGAGIFGALVYACMTDSGILNFSPRNTLLSMLVIPILFCYAYWYIVQIPGSVHRVEIFNPSTYIVPKIRHTYTTPRRSISRESGEPLLPSSPIPASTNCNFGIISSLLKYMIPLVIVYFAEYFINQGLMQLIEFDCAHGFSMSSNSQYRWYQVLYQLGVFISRSSTILLTIPTSFFSLLAAAQLTNATLFYCNAVYYFIPHISIIFLIIIFEGLLGGAAYVNTFKAIHREIPQDRKEFSLGFVSISDSLGIVAAGMLAIPAHNYVCSLPL